MPGPIAANTSELISAVQRVDGKCSAQVLKFKEDYMSAVMDMPWSGSSADFVEEDDDDIPYDIFRDRSDF